MTLPKLHIRDLFWLVLVVACLCAWGIDHRRLIHKNDEDNWVATEVMCKLGEKLSEAKQVNEDLQRMVNESQGNVDKPGGRCVR